MRTKGARNRTPEERVQLAQAKRLASSSRRTLPSERQKHVLDAIATAGEDGASLAVILRVTAEAGHPVTKGHAKSLVRQLIQKGLLRAVHHPVTYAVPPT